MTYPLNIVACTRTNYAGHRAAAVCPLALKGAADFVGFASLLAVTAMSLPVYLLASAIESGLDVPVGPSESTTVTVRYRKGKLPSWNKHWQWDDRTTVAQPPADPTAAENTRNEANKEE